jgi:hypothetical protein
MLMSQSICVIAMGSTSTSVTRRAEVGFRTLTNDARNIQPHCDKQLSHSFRLVVDETLLTCFFCAPQDLLDPIDWATYEPHLWSNAQRFYTRTAVLLGVLGQLSRPYGDAQRAAAGAAAAEINALNVLPVVPRFHYLPISTPSTATLPKQRSMHLSMHASAAVSAISRAAGAAATAQPGGAGQVQLQLPVATMSAQASDLAAQYMFADLGSSSKSSVADSSYVAGGAAAAAAAAAASFLHPTADTAAAAGASALSALQAKLQGSSFSAFGSMLGDRAAEVTAMAQNFGDMLPGSSGLGGLGGGLLSSFARRDGAGAGYGGR